MCMCVCVCVCICVCVCVFFLQKVSGSINLKLFRIFPATYVIISPQTVSKVSTNFYVPVVPGT